MPKHPGKSSGKRGSRSRGAHGLRGIVESMMREAYAKEAMSKARDTGARVRRVRSA